jgi:ribosome biogenesis protein Nip4
MKQGIVDEDIREDLSEISKNVQAVGRMIGSKRVKQEDFKTLSECLRAYAKLLDQYNRILKNRAKEI